MNNTLNDHILSQLRQEEHKKYGVRKGFPVHTIIIFENSKNFTVKSFFTYKGLREYLDSMDYDTVYTHQLVYVEDVKKVSFEA